MGVRRALHCRSNKPPEALMERMTDTSLTICPRQVSRPGARKKQQHRIDWKNAHTLNTWKTRSRAIGKQKKLAFQLPFVDIKKKLDLLNRRWIVVFCQFLFLKRISRLYNRSKLFTTGGLGTLSSTLSDIFMYVTRDMVQTRPDYNPIEVATRETGQRDEESSEQLRIVRPFHVS